ncbi:MAG: hypothetical protein HOF28_02290 [Nitrosopumilus sp.]|nr:hypothetical protein [Nitrosopumilus sp.]
MLVPVYAEVSEFSIEKNFYTNEEGLVFVGTEDEGRQLVSVLMTDPNGKESMIVSSMSNSDGIFQTVPKNVDDFFSIIGTYQFTAFTIQKDNGKIISLEYDGNKVSEPVKYVLQLNSIQDKVVEVEKTITFTASITDSSITNLVYTLEDAPITATIDQVTGKFVWTPSKSYGSFKDVIYNFDIIVNLGDKEDRENISITVKKAYDEPVTEPKVEPVTEPKVEPVTEPKVEPVTEPKVEPVTEPAKSTVASFVDATKDPQSYVNRYNNEPTYKEWFDENYSQYSSIYEAVGLEEPEFGICGSGTKLIDGVCTIIDQDYLHSIPTPKPWWKFW